MTDDDRVVLKLRYPYRVDGIDKLMKAAARMYGPGLVILLSHPDSAEWMVVATPENDK